MRRNPYKTVLEIYAAMLHVWILIVGFVVVVVAALVVVASAAAVVVIVQVGLRQNYDVPD